MADQACRHRRRCVRLEGGRRAGLRAARAAAAGRDLLTAALVEKGADGRLTVDRYHGTTGRPAVRAGAAGGRARRPGRAARHPLPRPRRGDHDGLGGVGAIVSRPLERHSPRAGCATWATWSRRRRPPARRGRARPRWQGSRTAAGERSDHGRRRSHPDRPRGRLRQGDRGGRDDRRLAPGQRPTSAGWTGPVRSEVVAASSTLACCEASGTSEQPGGAAPARPTVMGSGGAAPGGCP